MNKKIPLFVINQSLSNKNVCLGGMGPRWTSFGESLFILRRGTWTVDSGKAMAADGEGHEAERNRWVPSSLSTRVLFTAGQLK